MPECEHEWIMQEAGDKTEYICTECGAREDASSPRSGVAKSCAARDSREAPTSEEINDLPDHIRDWIHDLETRCDQQGDLRRLRAAEQKIEQLAEVVDLLEEKIREARVHANSRAKHILNDALKEAGLY